ncbi:MAG: T9SS C-terminal target domain-containing protein [Porphyromonadaceae bacterium]|nr:MAG: T9SS C-terminal target domain-containing protein [Porphyromonadaceae bacterium]
MKKISTILVFLLGTSFFASAQETLWTGETTPEAITYYDMVGWTKTDPGLAGKYFNFGTAEAISYSSIVDNPQKTGMNKSNKALILKSLMGKSWWPDFFLFSLAAPVSITSTNRYLHILHYRQNLNQGYSVNINKQQTWEDADKGTKRFDGNLEKASQWEDIVIDLVWFKDNAESLKEICVLMDKNWGGGAEDPTDYYFDEVVLNNDPIQRGVTNLLTGEKTPEAITYYDFVEWAIADAAQIPAWYVDFGGGKYTTFVDNPETAGINKTAKSLYMATTKGVDWWGNFLNFRLGTPITITEDTRYLHMFHYREILNNGWSVSLNVNEPLQDADKGKLRFDGNNSATGKWEDIVIDLKYLIDNSVPLEKMCIIVDKDWDGPRDNPATKYYFDEIVLSNDPLQRGVTILAGTDLLNCQDQSQIDALTFDTQNATNTYEIIDNPFTTSTVDSDGKVLKFHKSVDASWWQGMKVSFPGIHMITYGEKQYLHVFVRTDTICNIQLHMIDNADVEHTEMFVYPKDEIDGDWFDLVWDLSSYIAVKAITVRFDVRVDASQNWINNTPARDFYMDDVTLDANPDQRENTSSIGIELSKMAEMLVYSMNKTIYFSLPNASRAYIYDLSGRNVVSQTLNGGSDLNAISVPDNGIYILKVGTKDGKVSTVKIFVK